MRILSFFVGVLCLVWGAAWAGEAVPATAFFPVLPFGAGADASPQLIPFASNQPLESDHAGITRAVVIIHDEQRDAQGTEAMVSTMAGNLNPSTLIIAPQFLLPSDIVRFAEALPEKGRGFAAWQVLSWMWGDDSMQIKGHKSVSSFAVVDLLLMYLSDRAMFPDLRTIVVAGFGTGANFVQRYASFSTAANAVSAGTALRFVVAGATSYLYQTASRPLGGNRGFGLPDAGACPGVNNYPYGMEQLNPYARHQGANAAKVGYGMRFVTYLNSAASRATDANCAALAQGGTGLARAENYRIYLHTIYGDTVDKTHVFAKIPGDAADPVALFGSSCGMSALFGDGACASATKGGFGK
jgi:hypothetical protein